MTRMIPKQNPLEGVAWMLGSGLSFVGVNSIVRGLGADIPAAQSAFIRFAFGVVFLLPVLPGLWRKGLPKGALGLSLWRGAVHVAAVLFWFYAMARIPMAQVTAIGYLNPVILLIAGALLLGETLTLRRMIAIAVALCGTLIVLRPGAQEVTSGHLSQICAAISFAGSYLFAKRLSALVPASTVVALLSLMVTIGLLPLAVWVWVPIAPLHIAGLAVVAFLATAGHYMMTRAFRVAPMTVTQPVTFLNLVWAALAGSVIFAEPVDFWVLLGGGLIISAISWVTFAERAPMPQKSDA